MQNFPMDISMQMLDAGSERMNGLEFALRHLAIYLVGIKFHNPHPYEIKYSFFLYTVAWVEMNRNTHHIQLPRGCSLFVAKLKLSAAERREFRLGHAMSFC